jgi:hypothetical protein
VANKENDRRLTPSPLATAKLSAWVYPIGAISAGLACLAFVAISHRRQDKQLAFHAKQSCIMNFVIAAILGMFLFCGTVLLAIIMPILHGRQSLAFFGMAIVFPFCIGYVLNVFLNVWLAHRVLSGHDIVLPIVGKRLLSKTSHW